jgi:two-component system invasion response regulator UvrY
MGNTGTTGEGPTTGSDGATLSGRIEGCEAVARGGTVSDQRTEPVSVMIVDDQPPFRAAARAVVERVAGFELIAEVASGEAAVAASSELAPQLVLMDINMGELDGIEATRIITEANPATRVILVSTYAASDLPANARTSGAIAYVNKDELSPRVVRRLWEAGGDPTWATHGSA